MYTGSALCTNPELCHLPFLWLRKIGFWIVHGLIAGLTAFQNMQSATLVYTQIYILIVQRRSLRYCTGDVDIEMI